MNTRIEDRARFDLIRYANVWEDTEILCAALQPAPGKRILSIASGGDNALALAAEGADVVAADLSLAQLACVQLKCAALRSLSHEEVLRFLGIHEAGDRIATYAALEKELPEDAREYWRANRQTIADGLVHAGKFERYFHLFRRRLLPLVHSRKKVQLLLSEKPEAERFDFYRRKWDTLRWRFLFRVFFSRFVMGRLGRDPEFFRYVEGSVADRILQRTKYALTVLPTHDNRYLAYILTGNFRQALPWYLRPDNFEKVREGTNRLTLHHGSIDEAAENCAAAGFDGFNLSDMFEYLSDDLCGHVFGRLLANARPQARFAYWNMLVPRRCPDDLQAKVRHLDELSEKLFREDRAFFYSDFVVEEVRP